MASLWQTPAYEASAIVLVGHREQMDGRIHLIPTDLVTLQQLTQAMVLATDSRPVAKEVIRRLGLGISPDELLDNLAARQVETTQFVELTYTDSSAQRAQQVVNAVGQVSSERISGAGGEAKNAKAIVYEKATVPEAPVSPRPLRNGLLALAVGLALSVGITLLAGRRSSVR